MWAFHAFGGRAGATANPASSITTTTVIIAEEKANGAVARPADLSSDRGTQPVICLLSESPEARRHDSEPEQL